MLFSIFSGNIKLGPFKGSSFTLTHCIILHCITAILTVRSFYFCDFKKVITEEPCFSCNFQDEQSAIVPTMLLVLHVNS